MLLIKRLIQKKFIIFFAGIFAFVFFCDSALAMKIGVITDIHAGAKPVRDYRKYNRSNIVYPREYKTYFSKALSELKQQGVETVLITGDQTDEDKPKYAKSVLGLAQNSGLEFFWVKGNHDEKRTRKYFFSGGNYYFQDRNGWRFIVLDSTDTASSKTIGGVGSQQLSWLEEVIENAPGNVVVGMHHSIFKIRQNQPNEINEKYIPPEQVFSQSGKVKYVFSGHDHVGQPISQELNGVQYITNVPLTSKFGLGSYQVVDLPEAD